MMATSNLAPPPGHRAECFADTNPLWPHGSRRQGWQLSPLPRRRDSAQPPVRPPPESGPHYPASQNRPLTLWVLGLGLRLPPLHQLQGEGGKFCYQEETGGKPGKAGLNCTRETGLATPAREGARRSELGREKTEREQHAHGQHVQQLPPDRASNKSQKGGLFLSKCLSAARTVYSSAVPRELCINLIFLFLSIQSFSHTTLDI